MEPFRTIIALCPVTRGGINDWYLDHEGRHDSVGDDEQPSRGPDAWLDGDERRSQEREDRRSAGGRRLTDDDSDLDLDELLQYGSNDGGGVTLPKRILHPQRPPRGPGIPRPGRLPRHGSRATMLKRINVGGTRALCVAPFEN